MSEPDVIPMNTLSLSAAQRIAAAAIAAAQSHGVTVCIAVSDRSGEPIATMRMDGAPLLSAGIARNKAYSVVAFKGMATNLWWPAIGHDPNLVHGLSHIPGLVIVGGGVPVQVNGELVGAVGVSGASADQDQAIAESAAAIVNGSSSVGSLQSE
jgi:glc operon protein GlcG